MIYLAHLLILASIFSIVSMGTNLLSGYGGLIGLAQAGIMGVGAYAYALSALKFNISVWHGLFLGAFFSSLLAILVGYLSLRLKHDYFVISTLGLQFIVWSIFNNAIELTKGPLGIPGIPHLTLFGLEPGNAYWFLVFVLSLVAITCLFIRLIVSSPWGRVLVAIREDITLVRNAGKNDVYFKTIAFSISGCLCGLAGALYASYMTFIDPSVFTITESIFILSMVIIGGAGSLYGPVAGAFLLIMLPELLRFVGLPDTQSANIRQIIYGVALLAILIYRPQGIVGTYAFGRQQ